LSNSLKSVSYTQTILGNRIAIANEVLGEVTVIRGGERETIAGNFELYQGDIIETGEDGAVNILFEDNTSFGLSEDARMSVDEFQYDSEDNGGSSFLSMLKGLFVYTAGVIGKDEPRNVETPAGALGIRGDAGKYIQPIEDDILSNLNDVELAALDKSAVLTAGSPVSLYTAVEVPNIAFDFEFSYGFLDESGSLDIYLGDVMLYEAVATDHILGHLYDVVLNIDVDLILNMDQEILAFWYDGDHGTEMLLDNIMFGSLENGDFSNLTAGWFSEGEGSVGLAVMQTTTVPLPSGLLFFASAVGCFGWLRRKQN